jgi:hypothetical protein
MAVDLIDHGQKAVGAMAFAPVDFVHANGLDALQLPLRQTPLHEPLLVPR